MASGGGCRAVRESWTGGGRSVNHETSRTRFRTSPKQFLTWSATAANSRLQKMSKNLVYSVSKLSTKMTLPTFHHHHHDSAGSNASLDSGGFNSRFNSREDLSEFSSHCNVSVNNERNGPVVVKSILVKRNIVGGESVNEGNSNWAEGVDSNKNNNKFNCGAISRRKSSSDLAKRTSVECLNNNNNNNQINNNNSVHVVNNNNNLNSHRLSSSEERGKNKEFRNNIVLEMRSGQCFYNSGGSFEESDDDDENEDGGLGSLGRHLQNSSSSTISSAATTIPIMSPQGSRASSISMSSGPVQCDYGKGRRSPGVKRRSGKNRSVSIVGESNVECGDNIVLVPACSASKSLSSSPSSSTSSFSSPSTSSSTSSAIIFTSPLETSVCSSSAPSTAVSLTLLSSSDSLSGGGERRGKGGTIGSPKHITVTTTTSNTLTAVDKASTIPASLPLDKRSKSLNGSSGNKFMSQTLPNSKLAVTTLEEEQQLRHAPWFQAGIPREIALEVLRNEPLGSFIVRESTTKSGCFALSLRVPREAQPSGIAHYLILKTGRGYKIKGFTKEFGSLTSLITHHSVMPELLPCPLSLYRYRPKDAQRISRIHSSDFVEPEKLLNTTFYTPRKYTDF